MIIIKLQGGLGNQLFQYATALALATKKNSTVAFDCSQYKNEPLTGTIRHFELKNLGVGENTTPLILKIAFNMIHFPGSKLLGKILGRLLNCRFYKEKGFSYDVNLSEQAGNHIYLTGYFQSEKYFKHIKTKLLEQLQLPRLPNALLQKINTITSVGLHIRRGDYIHNKAASHFHGICSIEYYHLALQYLQKQLPHIHLFVFTDDHDWAEIQFQDIEIPIYFVKGNSGKNSYIDLILMSKCKHQIIANSSFSWWAAWLNLSPDKIVIAPKRWFLDEKAQSQTDDLIPETWIKI